MKWSLWLVLLIACSSFGQQTGGNGVPGASSGSGGGPLTGTAGGVLSGSYPNPSLASPLTLPASTSGQVINGTSYSAYYPQTTLTGRINACAADAMNGTNGNTTGICNSTGEAPTQTDASGGTIAIGDLAGDVMTWIHPATCHWTLSGYSGGTADLVDLYGGSAIEGPTPVNNPCEIIYGGGTNGAYAVFQAVNTTTSNAYFKVKGLGFMDSKASLASGATMVINSTNDGTIFEDLLVTNYEPGQSAILLNDAVNFGQCCTTTFNRVVANGNYASGPILTIIASNTNNQLGVEFTNVSLTHPGVGFPIISCTSANAVESLYFDNLYEEANKNDTTTALNQSNGCLAIKVSGMTVMNPQAATPAAGPIWQLNGSQHTSIDISGLTASHGITNPGIAVQNNISGYNCASTPCNYYTDANGNLPHVALGGLQADTANIQAINGISYSNMYTGATLDVRANACLIDAETKANGNTSGICSSEGEAGAQTLAAIVKCGDTSSDPVTWRVPSSGTWTVTATGSTANYDIDYYTGCKIEGHSAQPTGLLITHTSPNGTSAGVIGPGPGGSATYAQIGGFSIALNSTAVTSNAALVITGADNTDFHDMNIEHYSGGATGISTSGVNASGICCQAHLRNITTDAEYSGGIGVDLEASSSLVLQGLSMDHMSIDHPASGSPNIKCASTLAGTTSVEIRGLYEETSRAHNTSTMNQINGCGAFMIDGFYPNDIAGSSTTTMISTTSAANTNLVVTGFNPTNFNFGAVEVTNGFTGISTPFSAAGSGSYSTNPFLGAAIANSIVASAYNFSSAGAFTVSTLPSAASAGARAMRIVTDSASFTPGTCAGGGSDYMIAVSNGSSWSCH